MRRLRAHEVRAMRKTMGLTQAGLAELLLMDNENGNADRAVSRWENGRVAVPGPVSVAITLLHEIIKAGKAT